MSSNSANALKALASQWVEQHTPALWIQVQSVKGSTPRDSKACMLVTHGEVVGTIGGGHLEWQAIALAQKCLMDARNNDSPIPSWHQTFALGPTLGQCCGGTMTLSFKPLNAQTLKEWTTTLPRFYLDIHGAGHVGQAIVHLLRDIDCQVRWIDQRDQPPPSNDVLKGLPAHIEWLPTDDATAEVVDAPQGSSHLVITHRHDLDLALIDTLLHREDVRAGTAWVGMIGSRTKRSTFEHRLATKGHADVVVQKMHCPIGLDGIKGKEPAVIAVSVVAQLLQHHS